MVASSEKTSQSNSSASNSSATPDNVRPHPERIARKSNNFFFVPFNALSFYLMFKKLLNFLKFSTLATYIFVGPCQ